MRLLFLAVILTVPLFPQATPAEPAGAAADVRATPRGTIYGFLDAARHREFRRAASFLHLRPGEDGEELAQQFKDILDRRLTRDPALLSSSPEGDLTDGLEPRYELLTTVQLGGREVDLLLDRVNAGGNQVWLVSRSTVQLIPVIHQGLDESPIEKRLPESLRVHGPLDTAVWVWLALLILVAVSLALSRLFARLLVRATTLVAKRTPTDLDDRLVASVTNPMRLLLAVVFFRAGLVALPASIVLRTGLGRILIALIYLSLAWLAMRFIDVVAAKILATMSGRQLASASSVVPLGKRTAKVAAIVIAVLATLASWGYNTTAILAGLGVGGLAVALAAQKTIENLFGGVAITTDKPVLVGDFCKYGDKIGTVEDIGLRSTRIRTLDRTVVTIPNAQFSGLEIENFARRDKIFFHPILQLRRDATPDQLRALMDGLREVLAKHPLVEQPGRVRFIGISTYSLDLEIFSYLKTADFDAFLLGQEELLLSILDRVASVGTALAVPTQLNVVSRDPVAVTRQRAIHSEG